MVLVLVIDLTSERWLSNELSTMDSEWDRVCLKAVLGSIYSTEEIRNLGFDPDNLSDITDKVKFAAEEVENARLLADDLLALRLTAKKKKRKTEIEEKRNLLGKKKAACSEQRLQEI